MCTYRQEYDVQIVCTYEPTNEYIWIIFKARSPPLPQSVSFSHTADDPPSPLLETFAPETVCFLWHGFLRHGNRPCLCLLLALGLWLWLLSQRISSDWQVTGQHVCVHLGFLSRIQHNPGQPFFLHTQIYRYKELCKYIFIYTSMLCSYFFFFSCSCYCNHSLFVGVRDHPDPPTSLSLSLSLFLFRVTKSSTVMFSPPSFDEVDTDLGEFGHKL